jgi:hypothetical protein
MTPLVSARDFRHPFASFDAPDRVTHRDRSNISNISRDSATITLSALSFRWPDVNYCFKHLASARRPVNLIARLINGAHRNVFRRAHKSARVIHSDKRGGFSMMPAALKDRCRNDQLSRPFPPAEPRLCNFN